MTTGEGLGEGARELGDAARAAIVTPVRTPDPAVRREPDTAAPGRRPGSSRWPGRASSLSRVHVALAGVLAVAATVRLVNLNVVGFNSDEAVYAGQAAALAGNPAYADYFPVFRAHPMLVQTFLSVIFRQGEHDVAGRVLVAAFGVATVAVVYLLGRDLYDRPVGLVAAAVLALMPYHVIVTRQVLLDGPMVFFATLTLWGVAKYVKTERLIWMLAAGAALGLTLLAKESSIVLVGSVYAFLALTPAVRRPVVGSLIGVAMALALFAIHPLSAALSGHNSTTKAYLVWQLVRRPNHSFAFYLDVVPPALGLLVLALAVWAVWRARRGPAWREVLLASWLLVPAVAFTLWPVKGFQYLLAGAPAVAVLAARTIVDVDWSRAWARLRLPGPGPSARMARAGVLAVVTASLLWQLWPAVGKAQGTSGLAATGGVAGARETGHWVRDHTPVGAQFMTIGPSMANLIQFYGHRRAYGLSVSPNPLMRNPSYDPIRNPDARLRQAAFQYVVWDAYSAARSTHFSEQLLTYARRYNGRVIHRELGVRDGRRQPVIVIWAVRP